MHAQNAPQGMINAGLEWYNAFKEETQAAQATLDTEQKTATDDLLREDWGSDYRANHNMMSNLAKREFGEDADAFLAARTADGRLIENIPGIRKALVRWERTVNPNATIVLPGGQVDGKGIEARMKEIESFQGTDKYTEEVQQEWRDLYDAQQKGKAA